MAKISRIEKINCNSLRYDIQTTTQNFYANSILVHNSMITPIPVDGNIRWGTKMGVTDVALGAEEFVAKNPQYQELAKWCIQNKKTPIFEWVSRKQRIVIDYEEDNLILIAIRDNVTGEYMPYA